MLTFNTIKNAIEYSWRGSYINPQKFSNFIQDNSSDRRYKVSWKVLNDNSGIFTYRNCKYWFHRSYDGSIEVETLWK